MVLDPNVTYYGWIPILTPNVIASNKLKEGDVFVRVLEFCRKKVNIKVNKLDKNGFLSSFEVVIPEKQRKLINVECNIKLSGLTSFSFFFYKKPQTQFNEITKYFKNKLVINLFDSIRDLYHEHVHHEKKDDAILKPVEAKAEDEAIEGILNQYLNKVIYYHKDTGSKKGNILIRFLDTRKRINFLASGMGELVYAQSFVSLHKDKIKNWEENIKCFLRAFESLKILRSKLEWGIMFALSLIVGILTISSIFGVSLKVKILIFLLSLLILPRIL